MGALKKTNMADEEFKKWFPATANARFKDFNPPSPSMRVIAFPNAGNSEDVYSSEGSGARRQPSPVIDFCKANNGQLLSVQYPGRYQRKKEPFIQTAQQMAEELFKVLAPLLETPYVLLAHSVGTWISFELLQLIRREGLPMPRQAIFSAFPSPDIPVELRPWKVGKTLDEEQFKDEARDWSVNDEVFDNALWGEDGWNFHAIMRADFGIFDSYEYDPSKSEPFNFPIQTYFATRDKKVTQEMVAGWSNFSSAGFACEPVEGHHLFPLVKEGKKEWLTKAAAVLAKVDFSAQAAAAPADDSDDDLDFFC